MGDFNCWIFLSTVLDFYSLRSLTLSHARTHTDDREHNPHVDASSTLQHIHTHSNETTRANVFRDKTISVDSTIQKNSLSCQIAITVWKESGTKFSGAKKGRTKKGTTIFFLLLHPSKEERVTKLAATASFSPFSFSWMAESAKKMQVAKMRPSSPSYLQRERDDRDRNWVYGSFQARKKVLRENRIRTRNRNTVRK